MGRRAHDENTPGIFTVTLEGFLLLHGGLLMDTHIPWVFLFFPTSGPKRSMSKNNQFPLAEVGEHSHEVLPTTLCTDWVLQSSVVDMLPSKNSKKLRATGQANESVIQGANLDAQIPSLHSYRIASKRVAPGSNTN